MTQDVPITKNKQTNKQANKRMKKQTQNISCNSKIHVTLKCLEHMSLLAPVAGGELMGQRFDNWIIAILSQE